MGKPMHPENLGKIVDQPDGFTLAPLSKRYKRKKMLQSKLGCSTQHTGQIQALHSDRRAKEW